MRANSLIIPVVVLLVSSLAYSAEFESSTARIAAWNLEGFDPIPMGRLEKQAEGIATLDAEVITLVEVNPVSALQDLKVLLADDFDLCYNFEILEQTAVQHIGVMVKCGITIENPRFIPGSDLGNPGHRKALVVDVTVGEFDFIIIAVHLKSSRSAADQDIRDQQAEVIGDFISDFRNSNPREDILLMGDFNMIPGQDVSNFHFLGGDDEMDFISSWDLQDRYSHILETGRANLLDGFAITRTFTTEYIRGSLRVFPLHWAMRTPSGDPGMGPDEFRDTVSDHLPFAICRVLQNYEGCGLMVSLCST